MGNIHTIGPNEVIVKSGGFCGKRKVKYVVGGWVWAWGCAHKIQKMSLEIMTTYLQCNNAETALGVQISASGVAQCKIMSSKEMLPIAAEHFLSKSVGMIRKTIASTLEGHLRAILATLSVEESYKDRSRFAQMVMEVAAPDIAKMGIEILSFTIRDITDEISYLKSLGKTDTANVKRDAAIRIAECERDAAVREAECQKESENITYECSTKIENSKRMFSLEKFLFDKEVQKAKAEAELAYELQAAKTSQDIRLEELEIDVVERKKMIEVEEMEIERNTKVLKTEVMLKADADSYKLETIGDGKKNETLENASGDSEAIQKIGAAQGDYAKRTGLAEAERMRLKAEAYKKFGDAAITHLVLEALPKIAAEICAPLSKIDEIVILSGSDRITAEVNRLTGQIPPAVKALTGYDVTNVLSKVAGASPEKPSSSILKTNISRKS